MRSVSFPSHASEHPKGRRASRRSSPLSGLRAERVVFASDPLQPFRGASRVGVRQTLKPAKAAAVFPDRRPQPARRDGVLNSFACRLKLSADLHTAAPEVVIHQ